MQKQFKNAETQEVEYQNMKDKIAVLFPGIGYTCDKPLLYYAGKLAADLGYKVVKVPYGGFESNIKGNKKKMEAAFHSALAQAEELLWDISWKDYQEILFISKSVGTVAAAAYQKKNHLKVRNVLLTPLKETFLFVEGEAIVFHGTQDPWADTNEILAECEEKEIPCFLTEKGNHSLETGNIYADIEEIGTVMKEISNYLKKTDKSRMEGRVYNL